MHNADRRQPADDVFDVDGGLSASGTYHRAAHLVSPHNNLYVMVLLTKRDKVPVHINFGVMIPSAPLGDMRRSLINHVMVNLKLLITSLLGKLTS